MMEILDVPFYLTINFFNRISAELELHTLPEMVFGDNLLQVEHTGGFGIQFSAVDALRRVDNKRDLMKVAVAEEWQSKRYSLYSSMTSAQIFQGQVVNVKHVVITLSTLSLHVSGFLSKMPETFVASLAWRTEKL